MKKPNASEQQTPPAAVSKTTLEEQAQQIEQIQSTLEQVIDEVERQRNQLNDVTELSGGNWNLSQELKKLLDQLAQATADQAKATAAFGKTSPPWLQR